MLIAAEDTMSVCRQFSAWKLMWLTLSCNLGAGKFGKTNGYIVVSANGGLNQQRVAVSVCIFHATIILIYVLPAHWHVQMLIDDEIFAFVTANENKKIAKRTSFYMLFWSFYNWGSLFRENRQLKGTLKK